MKLNPANAHKSQIKIAETRQTQNMNFRFMPNAFQFLKPIQRSFKRVWVFPNAGANTFAKNQMCLPYEDKHDLYCMAALIAGFINIYVAGFIYNFVAEFIFGVHQFSWDIVVIE